MRKITAIVRADKLKAVEQALRNAGAPGFTYYDVKGHGREVTTTTKVAGGSTLGEEPFAYDIVADVLPRVKFEVICNSDSCDDIVNAVRSASVTGVRGDGIMYTEELSNVYRILTSEVGVDAL